MNLSRLRRASHKLRRWIARGLSQRRHRDDPNTVVWDSPDLAEEYATLGDLLAPEAILLTDLEAELPALHMLDIGVGGGRTTRHFAHRVGRYVGADYSGAMIQVCERTFGSLPGASFVVCDARHMAMFPDEGFDLALFSYNGLDYLDHAGRLQALREIRRTCRPGATFFFSSHNLQGVERLFALQRGARSPRQRLARLGQGLALRLTNPSPRALRDRDYAIINDGAHDFGLKTYYVKPAYQVQQLRDAGFDEIVLYRHDGKRVEPTGDLSHLDDDWIHYRATAGARS